MSEASTGITGDEYLAAIISARSVDSVIKTEFAQWLSSVPIGVKAFAVEGSDDRCAYYHWVKVAAPDLVYECFQCGNKELVLQLFDTLERDRTGSGELTYFFIDRDFDDLQGREAHSRIFMTDKYAIENYLVTPQVLDDLLSLEFHCNGVPGVRARVVQLFERVYGEHLNATRELNFRAFVVASLGLGRPQSYPERINQIATVELKAVRPPPGNPAELIIWERSVSESEELELRKQFYKLAPQDRFRGKFALVFFIKWLELLRKARQSFECELFAPLPVPANKIPGNFSFGTLAPKALPPSGLRDFVAAMG